MSVQYSKSQHRHRPVLTCLGMAVALASNLVLAQDNEVTSIVVSAQRQETAVGDIAASVYGIGRNAVETVNAVHINEVMQRVPGTWVSRGNGQESLVAIRSPVLTGAGSCGAFQMSQDGIPLRAAGFCNVNQLFEANNEQARGVEVILGPGSILYGANALHGAINILSDTPSEDFEGQLAFDGGPHDYRRVRGTVSNSVESQGFRLNFNGTSDGGYKDDSGFDQQKLDFMHRWTGSKVSVDTVLNMSNLNQETAGYLQSGYEAYKDRSLSRQNPNPEAFRDAQSLRLHSRIRWEGEYGNWQITPYYRDTEMEFLMHFLPGTPLEKNGQQSIGLQSMYTFTDDDDMRWIAGIDLESTDAYLSQYQASTIGGFLGTILPQGMQYDFDVSATLVSPFVQYDFQVDDNDRISLGLRYEMLDYDYDNRMLAGNTRDDGTACGGSGCRYTRPADRSDDFSNVSAQLGWIHELSDDRQVFANASRAFRAPQAAELYRLQNGQNLAQLDSEEALSYELGYRVTGPRASYSVTAYWMDKKNGIFQDSDRNNVSGAETLHRGVDMSANIRLSESFMLNLVSSYGRHTYENNPSLFGNSVDLKGNTVDTAPKWTGSARLDMALAQGHDLELEIIYMDEYFTDDANSMEHIYDGHSLVNLRYQADFDTWYLGARLTNLLDTEYAERADLGFGNDRYFVGEPRSLYLTLGFNF